MKTLYVLGFAFDLYGAVAMIKKNKPEWMLGLWNGVGGKIELNEGPHEAMTREFREETGQQIPEKNWSHRGYLLEPEATIYVYSTTVSILTAHTPHTEGSEEIQLFTDQDQDLLGNHAHPCIPNIPSLLSLVRMPPSIRSRKFPFFTLDYRK